MGPNRIVPSMSQSGCSEDLIDQYDVPPSRPRLRRERDPVISVTRTATWGSWACSTVRRAGSPERPRPSDRVALPSHLLH